MRQVGKILLFDSGEFNEWIDRIEIKRKVVRVQHHHTWSPSYKHFTGNNHFRLCESMENFHVNTNRWAEIGQNITTFPDGTIMICRSLEKNPAGIYMLNTGSICIENIGNFDKGGDNMTGSHRDTIIEMTKSLLNKFHLEPNDNTIVYHHWYDTVTGKRKKTDEPNSVKTCPGTNFFGGNMVREFREHFLPLIIS